MSTATSALSRRALVSGALVMLVVGFATKTLFFRDTANTKPAGQASSFVTEVPRLDASGVPVGFGRTRAGARDAAIAYVQMGDRVLSIDPSAAANVLRRVASRES